MDKKQIYDLDNRNVASENVKLGTLLNAIEQGTEKPLNELTEKQIYDLTNDTVTTQKIKFGDIIDALAKGDTSTIDDLTEEQIKAVNTIDIACQKVELGKGLNVLIEQGKKPLVRDPGLYKTGTGEVIKTWAQLISDGDILFNASKYGTEFSIINKSLEGDLIVGTGEVESLKDTFLKCNNLTYIDLSGLTLNAESGSDISGICADCGNLQGIKFNETFDTSRVVNMSGLFNGDNKITSINLSMFNTSNVTNMSYAFNCENLKHLDISSFDFTNVVEKTAMFANTPTTCEILVKDETAKTWINTNFPTMTNVKIKA